MAQADYLSSEESKQIYEMLATIPITMREGAYAQRFVKWSLRSCNLDVAECFLDEGFITRDSFQTITLVHDILSVKTARILEYGFSWTRTQTVWDALLFLYSHVERQKSLRPSFMFRGQCNSAWPITSTRSRLGDGDTTTLIELLPRYLVTQHPWAFPDQLQAAAQHYGYPTDLIDFTADPDVAAYFATLNAKNGDRGVIFTVDATCEGESRVIFLPPIFKRIHRQAGVFFEAASYRDADEKVIFDQDCSSHLALYDTRGESFDPLLDEGVVGRLIDALRAGHRPVEQFNGVGLEDYDLISALIQEIGCAVIRGGIIFNPQLVMYLVLSNVDWWRANIEPYLQHCRDTKDQNATARALMVSEYLSVLPEDIDAQLLRYLAPRVIFSSE